jgi:hypothetical protein
VAGKDASRVNGKPIAGAFIFLFFIFFGRNVNRLLSFRFTLATSYSLTSSPAPSEPMNLFQEVMAINPEQAWREAAEGKIKTQKETKIHIKKYT